MIFDATAIFSEDQAVTASAASTNIIDLKPTGTVLGAPVARVRDIGKGVPMSILVQTTILATAGGAATLTVTLETDDNSGFASAKTVWTSLAIPVADLIAGYQFLIDYVPKTTDERYFRVFYTVATGPLTAGAFTAGLTWGNQTNFS